MLVAQEQARAAPLPVVIAFLERPSIGERRGVISLGPLAALLRLDGVLILTHICTGRCGFRMGVRRSTHNHHPTIVVIDDQHRRLPRRPIGHRRIANVGERPFPYKLQVAVKYGEPEIFRHHRHQLLASRGSRGQRSRATTSIRLLPRRRAREHRRRLEALRARARFASLPALLMVHVWCARGGILCRSLPLARVPLRARHHLVRTDRHQAPPVGDKHRLLDSIAVQVRQRRRRAVTGGTGGVVPAPLVPYGS